MGGAKQEWIEYQERGYSYLNDDKYICAECINDYGLKRYVIAHSTETECSYCGKNSDKEIAISVNELLDYIIPKIRRYWADPNEAGMSYVTREGGWQGSVIDAHDLIYDQVIVDSDSDEFLADLYSCLDETRQWCKANLYQLDEDQVLIFGWLEFCKLIKHRARYVFFRVADDREDFRDLEEIPPKYFLDALGKIIKKLELLTAVDEEADLYRIRFHEPSICFNNSIDLGSPPHQLALQANRMSPAGIPMFYGSFDLETALREVYDPSGASNTYSYGVFKASRKLLCVDLTKIPEIPSIFDEINGENRENIVFLKSFLSDFTKIVTKDKSSKEHIDYIPTQVVTEYIRHCLSAGKNNFKAIDGVIYPSSKNGKNSIVLFSEQKHIRGGTDFQEKHEMLYLHTCDIGSIAGDFK